MISGDVGEDFVLKALNYGVIGLSAVMLVVTSRVLAAEQKREGYPRQGIVRLGSFFMFFCLCLAGLSTYAQIHDQRSFTSLKEENSKLSGRLTEIGFKAREIHRQLCDKVFFEVISAKKNEPKRNFDSLLHIVRELNDSTRDIAIDANVDPANFPACEEK